MKSPRQKLNTRLFEGLKTMTVTVPLAEYTTLAQLAQKADTYYKMNLSMEQALVRKREELRRVHDAFAAAKAERKQDDAPSSSTFGLPF